MAGMSQPQGQSQGQPQGGQPGQPPPMQNFPPEMLKMLLTHLMSGQAGQAPVPQNGAVAGHNDLQNTMAQLVQKLSTPQGMQQQQQAAQPPPQQNPAQGIQSILQMLGLQIGGK